MPKRYQEPFQTVSQQARVVMEGLGKGSDAYGLIHWEDVPEKWWRFKAGEPRIIDFEDCGYGYWMWDIGVVLAQWPWTEDFPWVP